MNFSSTTTRLKPEFVAAFHLELADINGIEVDNDPSLSEITHHQKVFWLRNTYTVLGISIHEQLLQTDISMILDAVYPQPAYILHHGY